jgi:hypothetical protein
MTDEQSPDEPQDEHEINLEDIKREADAERAAMTDDYEVQEMLGRPFSEIQKIAQDDDNPEQEIAREALQVSTKHFQEKYGKIIGSAYRNVVGTPPAVKAMMDSLRKYEKPLVKPDPEVLKQSPLQAQHLEPPKMPEVAVSPLPDMLEEMRRSNDELQGQTKHLAAMVAEAQAATEVARAQAAAQAKSTGRALFAAWVAVGVTVLVGVVQIIVTLMA